MKTLWEMASSSARRQKGTMKTVSRTFTWRPRPESGFDCLVCAMFETQSPSIGSDGVQEVDHVGDYVEFGAKGDDHNPEQPSDRP